MKNPNLPLATRSGKSVPVHFVSSDSLEKLSNDLPDRQRKWLQAQEFRAAPASICQLPDADGNLDAVLFGVDPNDNPLKAGKLSRNLPAGKYRFEDQPGDGYLASLGYVLGSYQFTRYRSQAKNKTQLVPGSAIDKKRLVREAAATFLVRDLINTPTNDMGPDELEKAFRDLAGKYKARVSVTKGNDLLKMNFPMIHAVGRASASAPRLLDMKWGRAGDPKVTLVGKGVCFDSGGLNIKPGSSMALMKKDMGGAANVLGLAMMIMDAKLPLRLRVLIPAVENSISANAFRPGDILPSRKGISVEIGNTDAEGRLVLGDALALGDEEKPDLMIDMATLTGAARVALGPDLPPFYTDNDELADKLSANAAGVQDPLWRMPLWMPYDGMLDSKIADTNHITSGGFAGSVTAALFLKKFVGAHTDWIHLDVFGWVPTAKPWAPVGGEAQGIRALFALISQRYAD